MAEPRAPRPPRPRGWRESIFVKLVALMLATGASLVALVSIFFGVLINRDVNRYIHRLLHDYGVLVAATSPDLETARRMRQRLGVEVRYDGPAGSWSTDAGLPSLAEARAEVAGESGSHLVFLRRQAYELVPAPDGGWYLLSWKVNQQFNVIHLELLALLAVFVLLVLIVSYAVLHRLTRPLHRLGEGVARLAGGELDVRVAVTSRDEIGRLTAAFNGMVQRVGDMVRARDQLLVDVSHELRSPLTRLKVALELIADDLRRQPMAADVAEMEAMLAELLERERLRDGRGLRLAPCDLVATTRQAVAACSGRRPGAHFAADAAELVVDLDGAAILTVLRNLLDNASKYALPDSRPTEVGLRQDADQVTLTVADDGPGIPAADLPSVFEPFFRVDRSRSKKTGGYGLGLAICKRIVEAHGGSIEASPGERRGVVFTLRLPRRRAS